MNYFLEKIVNQTNYQEVTCKFQSDISCPKESITGILKKWWKIKDNRNGFHKTSNKDQLIYSRGSENYYCLCVDSTPPSMAEQQLKSRCGREF